MWALDDPRDKAHVNALTPDVLVANGNITGMTSLGPAINAKLVDLTRQRMPRATRVALVGNPGHSLAQS